VNELRAEWTKLRTTPSTFWLLVAVILLTVGVSAAAAAALDCPCSADTTKISLTGVVLGQAVVAVLAVLAVSGEYSTGMVRVSLAAMPRRTVGLAARAAIVTGLLLIAATIAVAGSLLAGRLILSGQAWPGHGPVLRAAVGSVLYLALIGLLSLGAATAVRDSATAIGLVLGLLYVLPIVAQAVSDPHWRRHLQQFGPMSAGLAVQSTVDLHSLPIGPWQGLGVLAAWAAGALIVGGLLLRVRDA
jgi:ABC-2 type transport system permease protein